MFNYRIVVANKDLFISIFKSVGKDYNNYKETINNYSSVLNLLLLGCYQEMLMSLL